MAKLNMLLRFRVFILFALLILVGSLPAHARPVITYIVHAHFDHDDAKTKSQSITCQSDSECVFPVSYKDQRIQVKSTISPDLKITFRFYKDDQLLWTGNNGNSDYEIDGISKKSASHKIPLALPNSLYFDDGVRSEAVMRNAGPDIGVINIWVEAER